MTIIHELTFYNKSFRLFYIFLQYQHLQCHCNVSLKRSTYFNFCHVIKGVKTLNIRILKAK